MASLPVHFPLPVPFRSILFATDFSPVSDRALNYALGLAAPSHCKVYVVHAFASAPASPVSDYGGRNNDINRKEAENHIRSLENSQLLQCIDHEVVLRGGRVGEVLRQMAESKNIELIVLGTHGRGGIKKLIMGSVAEEVLRLATCPVLTVGAHAPDPAATVAFRRILLATDFSTGSLHALPYATAISQLSGGSLTLVHVLDPTKVGWSGQIDAMRAQATERLKAMIPRDGASQIETWVRLGSPGYVIVEHAGEQKADLIVMGAHATRAVATSTHLPWTVAHHVVCHAPCPVLTVLGPRKR